MPMQLMQVHPALAGMPCEGCQGILVNRSCGPERPGSGRSRELAASGQQCLNIQKVQADSSGEVCALHKRSNGQACLHSELLKLGRDAAEVWAGRRLGWLSLEGEVPVLLIAAFGRHRAWLV